MHERLQKILAWSGLASRRKAEELILAGRVTLNGQVALVGQKADRDRDIILVDGQPLMQNRPVVYLLNKPVGIVSTAFDPARRTTVLDLVPAQPRVFPVGRLDRMSEGALLLTNDGELALRLTHPRFGHEKEYEIWGKTTLSIPVMEDRLRRGAKLTDGWLRPDRVNFVGVRDGQLSFRIVIHEGRKHILRRLASALGLEITRLRRLRIGPLELGELPVGRYRELTATETAQLTNFVLVAREIVRPNLTNQTEHPSAK